jgi:hypothetical protein
LYPVDHKHFLNPSALTFRDYAGRHLAKEGLLGGQHKRSKKDRPSDLCVMQAFLPQIAWFLYPVDHKHFLSPSALTFRDYAGHMIRFVPDSDDETSGSSMGSFDGLDADHRRIEQVSGL